MAAEGVHMKRVPAVKGLGEAVRDSQQTHAEQTHHAEGKSKHALVTLFEQLKKVTEDGKEKVVTLVKNPEFQRLTLSTGSGALVLGTTGCAFGAVSGIFVGGSAGMVPALLTFGLSIPAGAAVGGISGCLIGSTTGVGAGSAAGYGIYKYRVQLKDGVMSAKVKLIKLVKTSRSKVLAITNSAKTSCGHYSGLATSKMGCAMHSVKSKVQDVACMATTKTKEVAYFAKGFTSELADSATSTRMGVTTSAAVATGTLGAITAGAIGAATGAAVGVVPAVFTFGLSIPIGAAIGLATGAATGCTVGVVGGGAAGFTGYTYRKEIKSSASYVHTKAMDSAESVKQNVKSLVRSGTGGTAQ